MAFRYRYFPRFSRIRMNGQKALEVRCSIQLSYGRLVLCCIILTYFCGVPDPLCYFAAGKLLPAPHRLPKEFCLPREWRGPLTSFPTHCQQVYSAAPSRKTERPTKPFTAFPLMPHVSGKWHTMGARIENSAILSADVEPMGRRGACVCRGRYCASARPRALVRAKSGDLRRPPASGTLSFQQRAQHPKYDQCVHRTYCQ